MGTFTKHITYRTTFHKYSLLAFVYYKLCSDREIVVWEFPYKIICLSIVLYYIY